MIWMVKEVIATLISSLTKYPFFSKCFLLHNQNLEIFVSLDTKYNDFLIFNNFLITFKMRNALVIFWNCSTNKKSIKKESNLLNIC